VIKIKVIEVTPPDPQERVIGYLQLPVAPPDQGVIKINDELYHIVGTRWEVRMEKDTTPSEAQLTLAVMSPTTIQRAGPGPLIDPDGRPLMRN
jgi:hypothetical protein